MFDGSVKGGEGRSVNRLDDLPKGLPILSTTIGDVAQKGERLRGTQEATGSTPVISTKFRCPRARSWRVPTRMSAAGAICLRRIRHRHSFARVAQRPERLPCKQRVGGSTPFPGSNILDGWQSGRSRRL